MYKINLIKNKVIPYKERKLLFSVIVIYFFICVIILGVLGYRITANFVKVSDYKDKISFMEKEFSNSISEYEDFKKYRENLKLKMGMYVKKFNAVDKILNKKINLSYILDKISVVIPPDGYVDDFEFNRKENSLNFNVIIPVSQAGQSFDMSQVVSYWRKDSYLMSNIEEIKSSVTQKQGRGGEQVLKAKFTYLLSD